MASTDQSLCPPQMEDDVEVELELEKQVALLYSTVTYTTVLYCNVHYCTLL